MEYSFHCSSDFCEVPIPKRKPKTTENEEIILFITTYNPNNQNIFPLIKQNFNNF